MERRAGPILANRSLSALIVASFVLSAFAGLYIVASPPHSAAQAPIGDLNVTSGTYTIEDIEQPVDGDVYVSGGELIIRNAALKVISNVGDPRTVTIGAGGTLTLEHGVLTSYLDQIGPWPFLSLTIEDGGEVTATDSSLFSFPGSISIENGGVLTLYDSSIAQIPDADLMQYVGGSEDVTMDSVDDGPAIVVTDSTLKMFDSSITDMPEFPVDMGIAGNLTLMGESDLLAVNSYIDIDFGPVETINDWYAHNMLVLSDSSSAYLYGCHFEPYYGSYSARAPAISTVGVSTSPAVPSVKGTNDDTNQDLDWLASVDGLMYEVEAQEMMEIDEWDVGGIDPGEQLSSASIVVTYSADPTYAGTNAIQWARETTAYASTGIVPHASDLSAQAVFELSTATVTTVGTLMDLNLRFDNNGGSGTGAVEFDQVCLIFTIGADVYLYRWLSVTVGDEYGVPIPDAEIDAVFTGSTELEGQPLVYYTSEGVSNTPPSDVLDYLGETVGSVFVTKSDGITQIPFLTDIIVGDGSGNSVYVGSFEITGSITIDTQIFESTETFSFPAYPAMTSDDQQFEVTVDIEGISAESPDSSRWLVVPPDLLIEDMEYFHAGDVIVASDGTLTLRDSVFRVVQSVDNEFTIYVDGTANFVIENSALVSTLPLNLIVKGEGTLQVLDSTLEGVDIVVMEDATILLDGASVSGTITTSWDSNALIQIYDSVLAESPVLSGNTLCEVTNTSAPSIVVENNARALIYRWIHITVFDGGDYPLEGATVYARFYVNETYWTSTVTDASGVARLNSLGTILTSTGSTYVGQYRVNASYWSDGIEYTEDKEVNVSVQPYTEPLTENATFAVLTLSDLLLPDLSITSNEIWTVPTEVVYNTTCRIVARIWNYGEAEATDVLVEFLDGATLATAELIGDYTVAVVSKGSWYEAYIDWVPDVTGSHTIWVTVNTPPAFDERTFSNNNGSIEVNVLGYANLMLTNMLFYELGVATSDTSIAGGLDIIVSAQLLNLGEATVANVFVSLTLTYDGGEETFYKTVYNTILQNNMVVVLFSYSLPIVTEDTDFYFEMEADPNDVIREPDGDDDNVVGATLLVLDIREDLRIDAADILIDYVSDDNSSVFGDVVKIIATVYNDGGTDVDNASIEFGSSEWTNPIAVVNESIPAGMSKDVIINFRVNITTGGDYDIYVLADSTYAFYEKSETNNEASVMLVVEQLEVDISIILDSDQHQVEDTMIVYVTVTYADNANMSVANLSGLSMELWDENDDARQSSPQATTNAQGMATLTIVIDDELESGTYTVVCMIAGLTETTEATLEIEGIVSGGGIPLLIWIIVIAVIAAFVIGVTVYTYVYGLGKLVECGECGEFIPASNKSCPKCGVEFEVGTMKCSECGAWVPAESAECPNCGVKFVGEEVEEGDYLDKMRKEYDEMISKYRELAKAELGKKFSDKKFEEWWVAQPTYISFDDWLAKEEEKRKESPVACPVCGTLNPKEATVCNRCGTVFGAAEEAPEDQESPPYPPVQGQQPAAQQQAQPAQQSPQAAPKMVIRRPIDRKVVPKKVIRTPISKDGSGGEGNEGYEGQ